MKRKKQENEKRERNECTFKPQINDQKSDIKSVSSTGSKDHYI